MKHSQIINSHKKGVMLFMVLSTILVVVALANIILVLVSSQSRLTRHQTGRIQANYAAQAGIQYAIEMLRLGPAAGGWSVPAVGTTLTRTLCRGLCAAPNVSNSGLPFDVTIIVYPRCLPPVGGCLNPPGPAVAILDVAPISASATYTTP